MRKKTRRKYRPLINPLAHVIEGVKPIEGEKLSHLRLLELTAIEAFRMGKATEFDWQHLCVMLKIAEQMSKDGIGLEVLEACQKAERHLIDADARYRATGRMGLTGEGLQAVRELHEYHDAQRTNITLAEYYGYIQRIYKRVVAEWAASNIEKSY
jgi:hypothetical protein